MTLKLCSEGLPNFSAEVFPGWQERRDETKENSGGWKHDSYAGTGSMSEPHGFGVHAVRSTFINAGKSASWESLRGCAFQEIGVCPRLQARIRGKALPLHANKNLHLLSIVCYKPQSLELI